MTSGGGGSTRAKEDGVGLVMDFVVLLFLDMVDALDESVEPPVMRLEPVQVAGTYETRFGLAVRGCLRSWSSL